MNQLQGRITQVKVHGNLSLIDIDISGQPFKAILIETPQTQPMLREDQPVQVMFKETEVVIGKLQDHEISLRNRLKCRIENVEEGALLSKLTMSNLAGTIGSVITTNAVKQLELETGKEVWAMIKTNEIMISE